MSLLDTINQASTMAGSQNKLAEMIGTTSGTLSAIKTGVRHCPLSMRARIAHIAGIDPKIEMIKALVEELSEKDPFEAEVRTGLSAILAAFPNGRSKHEDQDEE